MSEPILQINHLSKTFGSHEVLRDIDFSVNPGDVTSIIGASGSGKSTLLRCINLLETPTSGEILYHGTNIDNIKGGASAYRSHVGMVFQSFNLFNNRYAILFTKLICNFTKAKPSLFFILNSLTINTGITNSICYLSGLHVTLIFCHRL